MPTGRVHIPDTVYHLYQRTREGGVLFYSATDFLVFYTIFSRAAREHGLRVPALCLMHDHIHAVVAHHDEAVICSFVQEYTSRFSKAFNQAAGRQGPLFESPFGRARKTGGKRIRSTLAYVYNNPVERKLCPRAEQYRWNFLAYGISPHPFSEPIIMERTKYALKKALREIYWVAQDGVCLRHAQLNRLFAPLDNVQRNQLVDAIITRWSFIDYDLTTAFYGSYGEMLTAFASNTGSEFDIKETFLPGSDRCYNRMSSCLLQKGLVRHPIDVVSLDTERKLEFAHILLSEMSLNLTPLHLSKYLHLPLRKA